MIQAARVAVADFLNASPNEIAFGLNMTTITFHLARAIGRELEAGDEIVVTELDHHANVAPWRALERERGAVCARREDGSRPRGNWTGRISNASSRRAHACLRSAPGPTRSAPSPTSRARRGSRAARRRGTVVFVDAVHYAPHALVDVRALDCDFLACSAYKFYGPHIGMLYGKHERLSALDVPKLVPAPDTAPERMETGTQNHEGIIGAGAAVDFLASLAPDGGAHRRARLTAAFGELHTRGDELFHRIWEGLGAIKGVRRFGPPPRERRTPTIVFTVAGVPTTDVAVALARARRLCVERGFLRDHDRRAAGSNARRPRARRLRVLHEHGRGGAAH